MKYLVLALLFASLVGCNSNADFKSLEGSWKLVRFQQGKDVLLSADASEERRIIDHHVSENYEYIKNVEQFRANAKKEMVNRLSVFMEFNPDSTVVNTDLSNGVPDVQQWHYNLDEEKKQLFIHAPDLERTYKYVFEGDKLILLEKDLKITFQRQIEEK